MADKFRASAAAISALNAFLPSDLTEEQADKVLAAAEQMAEQVWDEATASYIARKALQASFRRSTKETDHG